MERDGPAGGAEPSEKGVDEKEEVRHFKVFHNAYQPEPSTAMWWTIDDPVTVRIHHQDRDGRYHTTASVMLPKSGLRVPERDFEYYPGVAFRGAFDFEMLPRFVLPQMVQKVSAGTLYAPAAWDEESEGNISALHPRFPPRPPLPLPSRPHLCALDSRWSRRHRASTR